MTKCFTEKIPARHILCFMFFSGFTVVFLLRVNINLAIVAMVKDDNTTVANTTSLKCTFLNDDANATSYNSSVNNTSLNCMFLNNTEGNLIYSTKNGTDQEEDTTNGDDVLFEWDKFQQGLILGAFFYGYMLSQIPGGRLAEIFGTKIVFGVAVFVNGVLSLLVPVSADLHWICLFLNRALQGICQGVMYPALSASIIKWVPISERSKFVSITVQGCALGPVFALPLCSWIITTWGWRAVFYFSGILAGFWYCAWLFLVFDTPQDHPRISKKEKNFLEESLQSQKEEEKPAFPWKDALLSGQFWVGVIAHAGSDYGFHTFYTFGPKYINEGLHFPIEELGMLSSIPYLCQYITANIFGVLADYLLIRCNVPLVWIRKVSVVISHWMPGIIIIILTFCGFNVYLSVAVFTAAVSMLGALTTGYYQNPIDVAPNFAGSLTGIANTFGALSGIICSSVAGATTQAYETDPEKGWHVAFYITACVYFATSLPFLIFAKSKVLPWNSKKIYQPEEIKMVENGKPVIDENDKEKES